LANLTSQISGHVLILIPERPNNQAAGIVLI
jgi:hypothetical protein